MADQQKKRRFRYGLLALILSGSVSTSGMANNNNNTYRSVDNWNVEGQHGVVHVKGSLTESPCHLAMTSSDQTVDMGNLDTVTLQNKGKGTPIPLHIGLEECLETEAQSEDAQDGMTTWSSAPPTVKIRFVAPIVPTYTDLVQVNGAEGLGLAVSTHQGTALPVGQASKPQLLPSGQRRLTYYVTPVRTGPLVSGAYSAPLIAFEMIYD